MSTIIACCFFFPSDAATAGVVLVIDAARRNSEWRALMFFLCVASEDWEMLNSEGISVASNGVSSSSVVALHCEPPFRGGIVTQSIKYKGKNANQFSRASFERSREISFAMQEYRTPQNPQQRILEFREIILPHRTHDQHFPKFQGWERED